MKYSVQLSFDSLEELQAFIDQQDGVVDGPSNEPAPEVQPKTRKRRTQAEIAADKAAAMAEANQAAAAAKEVPSAAPPAPAQPAAAAAELTLEDVKAAMSALVKKHGLPNGKVLLQRAGIDAFKNIKPGSYALVKQLCDEQLAKDTFDLEDSDAPKGDDEFEGL